MQDNKCAICHNNINMISNFVITDCKHHFHFNCIYKYIKSYDGYKCPLCRKNFNNKLPLKDNAIVSNNNLPLLSYNGLPNVNIRLGNTRSIVLPQHLRPSIRLGAQRRQLTNVIRQLGSSTISNHDQEPSLKQYISDLSFTMLKNKLKEHGLSSRGYIRENLEKKLYNRLLSQNIRNNLL
jgi:hypothetical protein